MNIDRKIVWRFVKVGQEPRVECNWRMVVTITLADGGESKEDLAAAADRQIRLSKGGSNPMTEPIEFFFDFVSHSGWFRPSVSAA